MHPSEVPKTLTGTPGLSLGRRRTSEGPSWTSPLISLIILDASMSLVMKRIIGNVIKVVRKLGQL